MSNISDRDISILFHIIDYCKYISDDLSTIEYDYSAFLENRMCKNSIGMSIAQIGELANHLSQDYVDRTKSDVPWNEIRGMRNVIVHNYLGVDIQRMWNTAITDIPQLQHFCEKQTQGYVICEEDEEDEELKL